MRLPCATTYVCKLWALGPGDGYTAPSACRSASWLGVRAAKGAEDFGIVLAQGGRRAGGRRAAGGELDGRGQGSEGSAQSVGGVDVHAAGFQLGTVRQVGDALGHAHGEADFGEPAGDLPLGALARPVFDGGDHLLKTKSASGNCWR